MHVSNISKCIFGRSSIFKILSIFEINNFSNTRGLDFQNETIRNLSLIGHDHRNLKCIFEINSFQTFRNTSLVLDFRNLEFIFEINYLSNILEFFFGWSFDFQNFE